MREARPGEGQGDGGDSPLLRSIHSADRLHNEQSGELGDPGGLSERHPQELEDARPGSLPWSTKSSTAAD